MSIVYLLTGSNIGDSHTHLQQALINIEKQVGKIVAKSSVYKTAPWGNKNQQDFLNQVIAVSTELSPENVLGKILSIEANMGRNRILKWEPRIIDIDILFYDNLIIQTEYLIVPHPLLHERRFTLMPLNEIASGFFHPVLGKTVNQLLTVCTDDSVVNVYY